MGLLGDSVNRFLRTKWDSVQEFAEECYAIFASQKNIAPESITINQQQGSSQSPLTVNLGGGFSGSALTVNRGDGQQLTFGDTGSFTSGSAGAVNYYGGQDGGQYNFAGDQFGDINFGGDGTNTTPGLDFRGGTYSAGDFPGPFGGTNFATIQFPGQSSDPDDKTIAVPSPSENPFMLYGETSDKLSGNKYRVNVWAKSPLFGPKIAIVPVRFPMVDPDELIPTGTICFVLCFPGVDATNIRTILDAIGSVPAYFGG